MGTQGNPKRPVFTVAVVQMNADSYHPFQHFRWRLDMNNAFFDRPGSESGRFDPFGNGNRKILMPRHRPVRRSWLIEVNAANAGRWGTENASDRLNQGITICDPTSRFASQQVPYPMDGTRCRRAG